MNLYNQEIKNLPYIDSEELQSHLEKIENVKEEIADEVKSGKIAPLSIALDVDDLKFIQNLADQINRDFEKVVVLGVGGSSLGGKTLTAIKKDSFRKIIFLESIDSQSVAASLDHIIKDFGLKNTLFLVISKSGATIETTCQTLIMIEQFKKHSIQNFAENFIFITESEENNLAQIAKEIGSQIYHHPKNIGGRFSYLSIVGLLPAAICGLNIKAIRNGAKNVVENFLNQKSHQNPIAYICACQLYLFEKGVNNNVIMPYIDTLKDFTDWYRQLWAESLGKNGFGSTPITSMGTVDQHSQLQLYLDGPKDKFFTFLVNKNPSNNFAVIDVPNVTTLFGGKTLNEIVNVEQKSTIEIINQQHLPIRIFELKELNEETLSAIMMQMFLETILIAKLQNINPFDQPAVELRKDLAKQYLID